MAGDLLNVRAVNGQAPGDQYSASLDESMRSSESYDLVDPAANPLESEEVRKEHRQLLEWFYLERERQAANRMEMAMDADFYDNIQWDPEDAEELRSRGQMPLVFNEVAPMVDWIIGTERRSRVDWKVLPRAQDDVTLADVKTKVLKYVADANRASFNRSRAFADAIKGGVGWLDDGARDDPTEDIIYSKYEDWRNVLWDSMSYDHDLADGRYVFRWRWVDVDIAVMMFPDREAQIRLAAEDAAAQYTNEPEADSWAATSDMLNNPRSGHLYAQGSGMIVDAKRRRVKLIECQYRKPARTPVIASGPFKGSVLSPQDQTLMQSVSEGRSKIIDKLMMRVHIAVFTEAHMLAFGPSGFRHNSFSLTPVWCYRRGRDRLPYGVIRRVRDVQQDLNKRASKALFMLNTNQIIADEGAVADWAEARDEVDRPDGTIVKRSGKDFKIHRDTDAATGQIQMMTLDAQSIQKSAGVSQENMGRQTNAVSGEAIKARQLQGSVVTTEPFDNLRLAVQCQGEKQLSLTEQWYTEEKVLRLTGTKGALEWVHINKPELQADGSVRFLNDVTASKADFVVSEQDYAGSLRQVMFESLNQMAMKLPPEVSLRLLTLAMEFSDLPNKDEIADQIRKMTGDRDPSKDPTPEELQQIEQQQQQQADALQMQRQSAMNALAEGQAKVRQLNAQAMKLEAEAQAAGGSAGADMQAQVAQAVRQVQEQSAQQIDTLAAQLTKLQGELGNRTLQINREADVKLAVADIERDRAIRVAEISKASDDKLTGLGRRMEDMARALEEKLGKVEQTATEAVKAATEKPVEPPKPAEPAQPAQPAALPEMTFNIQVDAKGADVKKTITMNRGADGSMTAEITPEK